MPNKVLTIGAAVGVAALVLLLTVLAGGPGSGARDQTPTAPYNPDDVYLGGPVDSQQLPLGEADGLVYEIKESGILFFADRVVPRPQGVIDVIETTAQFHLAPGRELTIDADEGTIVAPDNHPREGEMRGNVVVTLYETPDGSPVDFDSDRHVVIRTYFDEPVQFDLELQQIDSGGRIFMTGPQVQFRGRGLSLNYNQLRHRIERMVIEEGESLHYIPEPSVVVATDPNAAVPTASQSNAGTQASAGPARSRRVDRTKPGEPSTQPAAATQPGDAGTQTPPNPGRPLQFYLATFEELQDVRVGQDKYVIEGDDLAAVFSAKAAGDLNNTDAPAPAPAPGTSAHTPGTPRTPDVLGTPDAFGTPDAGAGTTRIFPTIAGRSVELASSDPLRNALLHALSASIGQSPAHTRDPRSLASFTDEDVVITWSGRLVISPLDEIPEALAGTDDVMVAVTGSPTTILTDRGETVLAPKVSYFSQNARLLAEGSDALPVTVDAPDMGTLIGRELSIDQAHATGYVLGPGKLTGLIREKHNDPTGTDQQPDTPSAEPNPQSPAPNSQSPAPNPKTSTPGPEPRHLTVAFDDRLDLEFYLKEQGGDPGRDTRSSPMSNARVKGVKTADFLGNVVVDSDELDMTSDRLTLSLLEEAPEGDDKLAVRSITARGNVKADVKGQGVNIRADRLLADPAKDQLELFGAQDNLALVIRPDATLAGEHIVMDQQGGTVRVVGPGWFDFLQDPEDPGKTVRVTWVTSMEYDDAAGTARFLGNVKTLSTDGTDTNELMGDDLSMVFVKEDPANHDQPAPAPGSATPGHPAPGNATAGRRLSTATMRGNVRFRARSYATIKREQMLTELFMIGPLMTFNDPGLNASAAAPGSPAAPGSVQMIQVVGTGRMLITDTRPEDSPDAGAKPGNEKSIDIAGRGRTAFQWSDRLILNMTHGIMTMKGAVVMVHQPQKGDRVQLDCQDLAAELKAPARRGGAKTPGAGGGVTGDGLLSKDAPKPELQRVWADGGIRILHGPVTVTSDHLLYEEARREILLWSDDPNQVVYEVQGEPTPARSSAFKWHRDTGRVEAFKLRTGTLPLRRGERRGD
jgi:lipopolysaccharide export system protein LptA